MRTLLVIGIAACLLLAAPLAGPILFEEVAGAQRGGCREQDRDDPQRHDLGAPHYL